MAEFVVNEENSGDQTRGAAATQRTTMIQENGREGELCMADMITIKALPRVKKGEHINTANIYFV
jgi:hypothetical protein